MARLEKKSHGKRIVLRVAVVTMSVAVAIGGVVLMQIAQNAPVMVPGMLPDEPRHPVTEKMMAEAAASEKKIAPFFKLPDTEGRVTLVGGKGPKPQFVYFIREGCPCSFDVEPLFQSLAKRFEGKIEFVSVTDAKTESAKKWHFEMRVPYRVISNPTLEMMKGFQVKASVMNLLIDKDGVIVRKWPGYSKKILQEMNREMAKLAGEQAKPFDAQYAPEKRTTGCAFGIPVGESYS